MPFTDQLTATGLDLMTLEERIAALEAALKSDISPILDTSAGSLMGQLVRIYAESAQSVIELASAVHSGQYPDTATGFSLALLAALTGTLKNAATESTIPATAGEVQLDAGITLPAGSVAHVDGDPTARFTTDAPATNGGGAPAWIPVAFTAEETGPIAAPATTLSVIAEPVTGWLDVNNINDAVLGENEESDTDLRLRRAEELQTGSTAVGAILTELTQTEGVVWVAVLENDTDHTDGNGLPPHSIEAVVRAPTVSDADLAAVIFASKAGGIRAHGDILTQVTDSQGNDHTIGVTRATLVDLYLELDLTYDEDYAGDDAVKLALVTWGDAHLGVGDDVLTSKVVDTVMDVEGVVNIDIPTIRIDNVTPPVTTGNYTINAFELADLDTARITVNSTEA